MRTATRAKPIGGVEKDRLVDRLHDPPHHLLHDLVFGAANPEWAFAPIRLGNFHPADRLGPIGLLIALNKGL